MVPIHPERLVARIFWPARGLFRCVAVLGIVCSIALQADAQNVETRFAANDVEFLNLMGNLEGPRSWGAGRSGGVRWAQGRRFGAHVE